MKGQIFLVGNSHIDLSWLWPKSETIHEVFPRTFTSVLGLFDKYPFLKFVQSSAQIYEWMEKYYPEIFEAIKKNVDEGRWEIVGGSWVEHSATIPCGESLVRQYLYGKRYFMEKFGVDVKIAWLPDTFGFCWSLPQIFKKCGIDYFLTHKLNWQIERRNPPIPFPYYFFWWQAADGSKIMAFQIVGSISNKIHLRHADTLILNQLESLKKVHGINQLLVLFGYGDHGGGITEDMTLKMLEFKEKEGYPDICFLKVQKYFDEILVSTKEKDLPKINDELYIQTHRGTLTTESMTKRENRKCEILLLSAERFLCIAKRYGITYPKRRLKDQWKKLLFNQVHDNLDGTSIEAVYQEAFTDYKDIERFTSRIGHLESIEKRIDTSSREGKTLTVFNPLPWNRRALAEIPEKLVNERNFYIYDQNNIEVPYQIVENGKNKKVIFMATVPAMGYTVYHLKPAKDTPAFKTDLKVDEKVLENNFFQVQINPKLNYAVKIIDKKNRVSIFNPKKGGNILEVYEDKPPNAPAGETAWNIYLGSKTEPPAQKVDVIERGPVRGKIRIERKFGCSTFTQDVVLCANTSRIGFGVHIDWHEFYRFAKIAFPFNFSSHWATYEIPFGVIQRYDHTIEKAPLENLEFPQRGWEMADVVKWEVSAQKWVDVSSPIGDYGVSLLNDNKYGFSFENDTLRMSLVRGARRGYQSTPESWTDQSDKPWVGVHHAKYAIYPHKRDWRNGGTIRGGYEFNYPLQVVISESHNGELPLQHSFVEVSPENVILTAMKEAEDSEDLIIRMYEAYGCDTIAEIKFDVAPNRVWQTDLMEWDKYVKNKEQKIKKNKVFVHMSPWEIKILNVRFSD